MSASKKKFVDLIAGTRPNFVKIAAIVRAFEMKKKAGLALGYRLVHTGQHYDKRLSGDFFEQLGIPMPDINLGVGSGSQAEQTSRIMIQYEQALIHQRPAATVVVGDVNSTMACAITAQKCGVPVAHVEAGIRSGDWSMPEEINRLVTDSITNWFFTTSQGANRELERIGVANSRIFFVGNTMIDTLISNRSRFRPPKLDLGFNVDYSRCLVLTLHRPSNVDDSGQLKRILWAIKKGAGKLPVLFPMHPRTKSQIEKEGISLEPPICPLPPLPYLEFSFLLENSLGVLTDSGGITEEATVLGVPCVTLRDSTERPETVSIGTNELVGTCPEKITEAVSRIRSGKWKTGAIPPKWDGQAGMRIVSGLESLLL